MTTGTIADRLRKLLAFGNVFVEAMRVAGMVENRSFEMGVGMLSPSSAAELTRRGIMLAVLPQGAFDVQSIRAAQTADPRAK